VSYLNGYEENVVENFRCSMQPEDAVLSTEGLPYLIPRLELTGESRDELRCATYKIGDVSLTICLDSTVSELRILSSSSAGDSTLHIGLAPILQRLPQYANFALKLSPEEMSLPFSGLRWKGRLFVREFSGIKRDGVLHITRVAGDMLIGLN
jgi:hypothetical protein